jgi:RNA polymerase sigma-70 factor (ECF subfamily)
VDDDSLVAGALAGRRQDFEALVERHQRMLYAFAQRMVHDRDSADEVVQRTFVRAYERLATFRGEASVGTWLHRIALNECRDLLRARRRTVDIDGLPERDLPATAPPDAGLGTRLRRLVERLPARQRTVLALRVFADLPFAEIARAEGISENAAKVSFHHAAHRLRAWLRGER